MAKNNLNNPLVSIIIPAYNAGQYLRDTVNSVINQTYVNIEIVIVDDGSTDNTLDVIKSLPTDPRIKVLNQKKMGASSARNSGYRVSKGSYIKFLDGDDLIDPDMISEQLLLASENPNCIVSAKWGRFYHNNVDTFKLNPEDCWHTMASLDWLKCSWKQTSSMTTPGIFLIPKVIVEKAGGWNEDLSLLDDTEYFARTILVGEKVIFCEKSTLYYRSGNVSLSGSKSLKDTISAYNAYDLTVANLLKKQNDESMRVIAANMWQLYIYDTYPRFPLWVKKAERNQAALAKATLRFPTGKYGSFLTALTGWKFTKRLQLFLKFIVHYPK